MENWFELLPLELLALIFRTFYTREKNVARITCTQFREVIDTYTDFTAMANKYRLLFTEFRYKQLYRLAMEEGDLVMVFHIAKKIPIDKSGLCITLFQINYEFVLCSFDRHRTLWETHLPKTKAFPPSEKKEEWPFYFSFFPLVHSNQELSKVLVASLLTFFREPSIQRLLELSNQYHSLLFQLNRPLPLELFAFKRSLYSSRRFLWIHMIRILISKGISIVEIMTALDNSCPGFDHNLLENIYDEPFPPQQLPITKPLNRKAIPIPPYVFGSVFPVHRRVLENYVQLLNTGNHLPDLDILNDGQKAIFRALAFGPTVMDKQEAIFIATVLKQEVETFYHSESIIIDHLEYFETTSWSQGWIYENALIHLGELLCLLPDGKKALTHFFSVARRNGYVRWLDIFMPMFTKQELINVVKKIDEYDEYDKYIIQRYAHYFQDIETS